jgi:hypothetical protein
MKNNSTAKANRSFELEEVALYRMFLSEALFEILLEKGVVTDEEVQERMQRLKSGSQLSIRDRK